MITVFSPQGMLGYGYPVDSFKRALSFNPDVIGVDAGSTDAGPYRLGSGKPTVSERAVKRDLELMLEVVVGKKIPLIIGSAGGAGAFPHVNWVKKIIYEIAKEKKLSFKMAVIYTDIEKNWLKKKIEKGEVKPLGPVDSLTSSEVDEAEHIVAVVGLDPFLEALEKGCEVILCGRSNDPAIFASYCVFKGVPWGLSFHLGKILECGAIAAVPGTASDGMLAFAWKDRFVVEPASEKRVCTELSVAAHSLYEKSHPYLIPFPEGMLNLKNASFKAISERRVEVKGSKFEPSDELWIKLEGAKSLGYRSIAICAVRDPYMISAESEWTSETKKAVFDYFGDPSVLVNFKLLGGEKEKVLVLEAVAESQEMAQAVCSFMRSYLMHYHYKGRKSTSGNLALLFSPSEIPVGKVFQFNIHHLVRVDSQKEIFSLEVEKINF